MRTVSNQIDSHIAPPPRTHTPKIKSSKIHAFHRLAPCGRRGGKGGGNDVLSWGGVGYDFCLGVCGGGLFGHWEGGYAFWFWDGVGGGQGVIFGFFSNKEYSILQPDLPNLLLF